MLEAFLKYNEKTDLTMPTSVLEQQLKQLEVIGNI
jgi:hypothetical protein